VTEQTETNGAESDTPASATPDTAPVAEGQRISSLDTLRGLALLGILVMNIPFFALPSAIWFSPPIAGGFEGLDYATWLGSHLLFDMKMMSLFSMLFGAGIVLFADKAIAKSGAAGGLHYRRMGWLLAIGLVHAYIIWEGDILVAYAICGMIAYPLRHLGAKALIPLSAVLLSVVLLTNWGQGVMFDYMRDQSAERAALVEAGEPVPPAMSGWADAWDGVYDDETGEQIQEGMVQGFYPGPEDLAEEREAMRGSFLDRIEYRAGDVLFFQTYVMLTFGLWRVTGMIALGMALYKTGVLTARRSARFYAILIAAGLATGVPLILLGVRSSEAAGFDTIHMFKAGMNYNYAGSVGVALAWIGVVMLVCKSGLIAWLRGGLAAVGRMAFTNYLAQSLICSVIFFGWGFGYFGELSRSQLVPIVLAIWAFQIVFSVLWLKAFRFGPMEWAWRSLTYWRMQPMKR